MKRKGKFYSKDEKQTLIGLGLIPTKASGAGWVEKEDGFNEEIMVQLKSTDADSYRIRKYDLDLLEYHAGVERKIPVFLLKFLGTGEIYAIVKAEQLKSLYVPDRGKVETFVEKDMDDFTVRKKVVSATNRAEIEKFHEKERAEKKWKR